jgi:hypothetical protein
MMRSEISPYRSEWARRNRTEGRNEGKIEGKVETLLQVLEARGVPVPADARERITACTDVAQIEAWVKRSVIVRTVDALFD